MCPVAKRHKRWTGVKECIEGVVDAVAKVVLKQIDLHVLEEMQLIFAINDALHYYCIIASL